MGRLWGPLLDGAARALDLSASMFAQRRPRSVADLSRAADLVTIRAFPPGTKRPTEAIQRNKLFVGNLPYELGSDDLEHAFAAFGEVISAAVIMDRATGRSKGFGFVEMANITEEIIQSLDGAEIRGRRVSVSEARPKSETERTRMRSRPQPHKPLRDDGAVLPAESTQDAALDSPRELVPAEVQPMPDVAAQGLPTIRVEIILPGTEMEKEADRVLSGVGG